VTGCSEWRGLMAMDAVGGATSDESRKLGEHLEGCAACRQDAEEVQVASAALALLDSVQVHRLERGSPLGDVERRGPAGGTGGAASWEEGPPDPVAPDSDRTVHPPVPPGEASPSGVGRRRARRWVTAGAVASVAAAVVAAILLSRSSVAPPASRTVALSGQPGVTAAIALTGQSSGTRAVLRESGQPAGKVFTVAMQDTSGQWWVAGSYRTASPTRVLTVQLTCAVPVREITSIWVTDPSGHRVLTGYAN
jgi:hypothetical protein